jgi:hypothetical protein
MNQRRSFVSRIWSVLGIATSHDARRGVDRIDKRLDRYEQRAQRITEHLDEHSKRTHELTNTVAELRSAVASLQQAVERTADQARLVALTRKQDLASLEGMRRLEAELERDSRTIEAHLADASSRARISSDPFPHVVIEGLLPESFYAKILEALPPGEYWRSSGRARDYWEIDTDPGPWQTEVVWRFVDRQVVEAMLRPRLLTMFSQCLASYWRDAFEIDGGRVTYHTSEGRLQCRRKGYLLRAHLDPPHAALTGLFYLAQPGDDPRHGTHLYRSLTPIPVRRNGIYYPEDHGIAVETVATVPFKANNLLVWMTAVGAHGADLTAEDVPTSLERYTYQFQLVTDHETRKRIKKK